MSARRMRRWSNWSGASNQRRVVHRHLGAEAAVAEVGPVADLAVADAHEIGQAIAGHVGEVDGLRCRRRRPASALLLRPAPWARARAGPKPASASEGYQQKTSSSVIRMSAWPSPVEIDELQIGIVACRGWAAR